MSSIRAVWQWESRRFSNFGPGSFGLVQSSARQASRVRFQAFIVSRECDSPIHRGGVRLSAEHFNRDTGQPTSGIGRVVSAGV